MRVSAERVFELARHLTERDREIALVLFEQQVLTTDQLALLFSRRGVGLRIGCCSSIAIAWSIASTRPRRSV